MATEIEAKIYEALAARLDALTTSPALSIAHDGVDFEPTDAGYIRAKQIPNQTLQRTVGSTGRNVHRGIYLVDVVYPSGGGSLDAIEIAGQVASHFKRGTDLTNGGETVHIYEPPTVNQALTIDGMLEVQVSVPYQAFTGNPA